MTAARLPGLSAAVGAALSLLLWPASPYLAVYAITLIAAHAIAGRVRR